MSTTAPRVSDAIDARPLGRFQKSVVALCALLALVEGFDAQNAGYAGPALARAWALSAPALGLFFSLGLFGIMVGAILVAPLADRIGRKPVILGALVLFGAASLGMAASVSLPMISGFRFLTGLGIGAALPNAIAMTTEYVPARVRSQMVVLMFGGFICGAILAGVAASRMVELLGWRSVFVVGGVLPLALAPVILRWLPESVRFLASRPGAAGRVSAVMRRIDPDLRPAAGFAVEAQPESRGSVRALFSDGRARRTVLLWVIFFSSLLVLFLLTNWLPTQMAALGFSVGTAILLGTLLQVGGLGGMVLGWLMDRVGANITLAGAYLLAAAGVGGVALAGDNLPLVTVSVLLAGFGIIGGQASANALAAATYPTEIRSTGVGWCQGVGRVGSIVGPSLAGLLLSMEVSNRDVFLLAALPALAAAAAALAIGPARAPAHVAPAQA